MARSMQTMDGNMAAAHVSYAFTEVAAIYPITPSSNMAEYTDEWAAKGKKNIFGEPVKVVEMQSEGGAAGAVHGSLQAGALTTTYTASQGLLLMIPNMYKIAGELLPGVLHVSARALASHALSIFGDHTDVYSTRQTGFAMLCTGSVQEVMDIGSVAHLAAIKSRVPFLHFFDGFRTSHEIQKVEVVDYAELAKLVDMDAVKKFREEALNPNHPVTRGTAQNPDVFFQAREACNKFYDAVPDIVADYMKKMSAIVGREYKPFVYYGAPEAENIIVCMGSISETVRETIDYLNNNGEKVGAVIVHLFRPFSTKYLFDVMPKSVKRIAVLDRSKEPGSAGEALYLDVKSVFYGKPNAPMIVGGRYGLSSKDTTPAMIASVYDNLKMKEPKDSFSVGIVDDVTFQSLPMKEDISVVPQGTIECKFFGLGSDGTVGANKNSIKIIGDHTDMYAQAYFAYDSKKSGGFTVSHLRFGNKPIRSPYLVNTPDFVSCSQPSYLDKYDMLKGIKKGGTFLLNSIWDAEETKKHLPEKVKKQLADADVKFYIINATKIAEDLGMTGRTNTILQSAFFKLSAVIPYDEAVKYIKEAIKKSYGKKGDDVVKMNNDAVDKGSNELVKIEIPAEWKSLKAAPLSAGNPNAPEFVKNVVEVINGQDGDLLPVSAFAGREDGTFPNGTTEFEKRGIAVNVPEWVSDTCIQCNQCAYVCPHAVIRPFLISEDEMKKLPADINTIKAVGKGLEAYSFRMQVSPLDCTGCGNCADVCPAPKGKALVMKPLESQLKEADHWLAIEKNVTYKSHITGTGNVKNSQFAQPLFEFSGACGGCGETPYIKLITQLFGDRMMIANATGCSSIYGGSCPSTPYRVNAKGQGPAWGNSLFEDNAEYGLGMFLGVRQMRDRIERFMTEAMAAGATGDVAEAFKAWIENKNNGEKSREVSDKVEAVLSGRSEAWAKDIMNLKQYLVKTSQWVFGGDGWAYDIGYGGLDHVLASGEDVNVLVVDTEVYSNTGGQASKSTPVAAIAKFAASGKRIRKKDLGLMAASYGYVYVAQVSMGANQAHYYNVLKEAEAYPGPSLIIAYAPCINHGLRQGMGKTQLEAKQAVECGYWHLWRYNPLLEKEGKNPFSLDSKEPDWSKFQSFIGGEVRYTSLKKEFPDVAEELFKASEENAKWRLATYKRLAEQKW
ncbi:MAG TPA: pyruvate:ferredoxin (flavodoxin) oxidoreductase [Spirochaetota bacterium]|nr:pyruvate:ferredoxin (flavodoxin) oxidoreductase [Spirochaetota bacterium]HOH36857.1 pyruvate:ferredoxin (flavodoxin) oxidoreductase [Spirochaetota bacterium]HPY02480.1 pyruvate:ferredoxin (flavodoxin) oxidoreductase [Spirochaetota bacterium]HQA52823.1 pyruvate:ferredoxin (flavodoxin) oxidoreductase [Spirochaetota bacterium]